MPNQHKNALLGWNPADPTLKPWVKAEAERRGMTIRELLDEALGAYRKGNGMYTAEKHGATFRDWMPAGEIHCIDGGGEDKHVIIGQPRGGKVSAWLVERTDRGTGDSWYTTGGGFYFWTPEDALQWAGDHYSGITRIGYGPADLSHEGRMSSLAPEEIEHLRLGGTVVLRFSGSGQLPTCFEGGSSASNSETGDGQ
jgi:hypothetical protein